MKLDIDSLDFERCEDEPIHTPESIQAHGYLFALEKGEGRIQVLSENVADLVEDYRGLVGQSFFSLLAENEETEFLQETWRRTEVQQGRLPVRLTLAGEPIRKGAAEQFHAVVYSSGDLAVVELEPAGRYRDAYAASQFIKMYAMKVAPKFEQYGDIVEMSREIVETIKYVTEMERVVLYKFKDDGSGQVIAEAKEDDLESYLGVHYPAYDIPAQARELYKKNWVRLTPDAAMEPTSLYPSVQQSGRAPLDMTHSILRTLSPVHLQYVINQGLRASLSFSLVTHDNLWGLISCHHRSPKYVPQSIRLECENLSQLFSWHLYAKEEEIYINKKRHADKEIDKILDAVSPDQSIVDVFQTEAGNILEILGADGFVYHTGQDYVTIGVTPELSVLKTMHAQSQQGSWVTSDATEVIDTELLNGVRGVLLVDLDSSSRLFTAWFRKEDVVVERWAGLPNEKSAASSKRERLMPRSSFEVHTRHRRGRCIAWSNHDVEMASRFNKVFMAYALHTQERMRQNISDLELQDKYKDDFLATLAHELRNPLAAVSTGVELLDQNASADREVVSLVKTQVTYMVDMIDDLMDVSRITRGKVKLKKSRLRIDEIVSAAIRGCDQLIAEKDHTLNVTLPDQPLWVHGDSTRLSQVFTNLISNAARYTPPGGVIEVAAQANGDKVEVVVRDNGIGISADQLDQIFTTFTQLGRREAIGAGLGIGLALVKKLAAMHQGTVTAHSEGENMGSTFTVSLPLTHPPAKPKNDQPPHHPTGTKLKKRILIVDDVHDIRFLTEKILQSAGHETRIAGNAQQAVEVFDEFQPEVAIFDIGLPDRDGYELCKELSARPHAADTLFIAQSGWSKEEDIQKSHAAGFHKHMVKPVDLNQLLQLIQDAAR